MFADAPRLIFGCRRFRLTHTSRSQPVDKRNANYLPHRVHVLPLRQLIGRQVETRHRAVAVQEFVTVRNGRAQFVQILPILIRYLRAWGVLLNERSKKVCGSNTSTYSTLGTRLALFR